MGIPAPPFKSPEEERAYMLRFMTTILVELKAEESTAVKVSFLQDMIDKCINFGLLKKDITNPEIQRYNSTLLATIEGGLDTIVIRLGTQLKDPKVKTLFQIDEHGLDFGAGGLAGEERKKAEEGMKVLAKLQEERPSGAEEWLDALAQVLRNNAVAIETAIFEKRETCVEMQAWVLEYMMWFLMEIGKVASGVFFEWPVKMQEQIVPETGIAVIAGVDRPEPLSIESTEELKTYGLPELTKWQKVKAAVKGFLRKVTGGREDGDWSWQA